MASPAFLTIPSKPDAPISYTFFPGSDGNRNKQLIIFINGLGLPAASWNAGISLLRSELKSYPPILTFDRFGQGLTTSRDPLDKIKGSHDFFDGWYSEFNLVRNEIFFKSYEISQVPELSNSGRH
jgi:pimeloyl-ACP methyl ester carboxylesterase